MLRENNRIIRNVLQSADLVITAASFVLAYALRSRWDGALVPIGPFNSYLFLLFIILPLWTVLFNMHGVYNPTRTKSFFQTIGPFLRTTATGGVILMTILYMFRLEHISRAFVILFLALSALLFFVFRTFIYSFTHYIRSRGYNFRTILIVGSGKRAEAFAEIIGEHREWGLKLIGFVDLDAECTAGGRTRIIGSLDAFKETVTRFQVDEVVFVVPRKWLDRIEDPILVCEQIGIKASIAADFYPHSIAKTSMEYLMGWPMLAFSPTAKIEASLELKRAADIVLSLMLIIVTLPFFIGAVIGLKTTSRGPVFFRQERCGLNGRRFNLLKFRTMVDGAEGLRDSINHLNEMSGPVFKVKDDPRVTGFGRFLRKYSLDELPQFLNVLKGDMSIVGPRPPIPAEVEKYDTWQRRRLSVRPGITCLWQVNGRNNIDFDEWMKLDLEYIDNWSLKQDMKILLKTIPAVFRGTGL